MRINGTLPHNGVLWPLRLSPLAVPPCQMCNKMSVTDKFPHHPSTLLYSSTLLLYSHRQTCNMDQSVNYHLLYPYSLCYCICELVVQKFIFRGALGAVYKVGNCEFRWWLQVQTALTRAWAPRGGISVIGAGGSWTKGRSHSSAVLCAGLITRLRTLLVWAGPGPPTWGHICMFYCPFGMHMLSWSHRNMFECNMQ